MPKVTSALITSAFLLLALSTRVQCAEVDGSALYSQRCASCHDRGDGRAPDLAALRQLPASAIINTLQTGAMRFVGWQMPDAEREAVARFISRAGDDLQTETSGGFCKTKPPFGDPLTGPRWLGWGADTQQTRYQSGDLAGMSASDVPRLKLRWAFGYSGSNLAWAHPSVAAGRVFVGSSGGTVYSLDAASGCTYWAYEALGPVRAAIQIGSIGDERFAAYFGDLRGNVYAINAETGTEIWRVQIEEHPTTRITSSPTLYEGRIYVGTSSFEETWGAQPEYECCTFRGSVSSLDARTGERIWKTYLVEEPQPTKPNRLGVQLRGPSGAGVWTAPTIDEKLRRLYVTTGDNYSDPPTETSDAMIALDLDDGQILWSKQFTANDAFTTGCVPGGDTTNCPESRGPDYDFGASANLVSLADGKRVLVAGQKSGWVHAVDPDQDGKILWQRHVSWGGVLGGIQWGTAADASKVYVALSDLRIGLSRNAEGATVFGANPNVGGGIMALDLRDGSGVWYAAPFTCGDRPRCSPGQSAAVTAIPGVVFSGALDGHLRAYSTEDGSVLWDVDTVMDYDTVNGVTARGGSLNGPGPVIVGGMLFVNSGYGQFGTMPGNVLLAFDLEDE